MRALRALGPRGAPLFPAWAPALRARWAFTAPPLRRWRPQRAPRVRSGQPRARQRSQAAPRALRGVFVGRCQLQPQRAPLGFLAPRARAPARRARRGRASRWAAPATSPTPAQSASPAPRSLQTWRRRSAPRATFAPRGRRRAQQTPALRATFAPLASAPHHHSQAPPSRPPSWAPCSPYRQFRPARHCLLA